MKKTFLNHIVPVAALLFSLPLLPGCGEDLSYDPPTDNPPVIASVTPSEGSIGTVVTVGGEYLQHVQEVTVGGQAVTFGARISDTEFTFIATSAGRSGEVAVKTPNGTVSFGTFTYQYVVPTVTASGLDDSREIGRTLVIPGTNLGVVESVWFKADGVEPVEALILKTSPTEIEVVVPFVDAVSAKILLGYFDGTGDAKTPEASAPSIGIKMATPVVTTTDFSGTHETGTPFVLAGVNLDNIEKVFIDDQEATISAKASESLTFVVPTTFSDGTHECELKIVYANGTVTLLLSNSFEVFVPAVLFWKDMKVWGQGSNSTSGAAYTAYSADYMFASFFTPNTGVVHSNSNWSTQVDPISFAKGVSAATANNKITGLTLEEYNSVAPYFFFSGTSAGPMQLNSPANSNSQLKNFYKDAGAQLEMRITGNNNDNYYGTPMLTFLYLDPSVPEHAALRTKVLEREITSIDETTFVLNTTDNKINDIAYSTVGAPNSNVWAPGLLVAPDRNISGINAVILVFYHGLPFDASGGNNINNVKRIGLLHIQSIGYRAASDSNNPRWSDVTFSMYWQKRDYDYTKLP